MKLKKARKWTLYTTDDERPLHILYSDVVGMPILTAYKDSVEFPHTFESLLTGPPPTLHCEIRGDCLCYGDDRWSVAYSLPTNPEGKIAPEAFARTHITHLVIGKAAFLRYVLKQTSWDLDKIPGFNWCDTGAGVWELAFWYPRFKCTPIDGVRTWSVMPSHVPTQWEAMWVKRLEDQLMEYKHPGVILHQPYLGITRTDVVGTDKAAQTCVNLGQTVTQMSEQTADIHATMKSLISLVGSDPTDDVIAEIADIQTSLRDMLVEFRTCQDLCLLQSDSIIDGILTNGNYEVRDTTEDK